MLSSLLLLQLSFSAPNVFAGTTSETAPVTVPSGWTGVSAGTNQTGYPYRSCSIHLDTGTLSFKSVNQTEGYCAIRWDNQGTTDHQSYIELGIVNGGYVLKQGFDYILNLRVVCFPMGNPVTTTTVELGAGDFSMTKALSAGSTGVFEWEVRPDRNISLSEISLTISNNTTSQLIWVYPLKILETNPNQAILDGMNAGFAAGNAAQESVKQQIIDSTSQLQDSINSQTQTITDATEQQTSAIGGFFENLLNGIMSLFIPSTEYFTQFFNDFNTWMEEHFGALYYPIALIVDVLQRLAALPVDQQPSITLPGVTIQGQKLWDETTYKFDFSDGLGLNTIYQLYLTVVDCIIAIGLVNLAKRKMEEIQKGV